MNVNFTADGLYKTETTLHVTWVNYYKKNKRNADVTEKE